MSLSVIACDGSKLVIVCRHIPPGKGVASDVFVEPLFGSSYLTEKSIPKVGSLGENTTGRAAMRQAASSLQRLHRAQRAAQHNEPVM